jgi:hypothetical protein
MRVEELRITSENECMSFTRGDCNHLLRHLGLIDIREVIKRRRKSACARKAFDEIPDSRDKIKPRLV